MPSKNSNPGGSEANAVEKFKPKTIDGCNTCPPAKACEGPEITVETSGCLDGGGSFNLRGQTDEIIPLHVECPGDGKLKISTGESIKGGGEFSANQFCDTEVELEVNNAWLDRFVMSRIGNGKLTVEGDFSIEGGGEFHANQQNDTNIVLTVDWTSMPIDPNGGLMWQNNMLKVGPTNMTIANADAIHNVNDELAKLSQRVAALEGKVG